MNRAQLLRIAWKDHRRMRTLWYGMAAVWILILAYTTMRNLRNGSTSLTLANSEFMLTLIPFFLIVYGLAWAAITFSAEHEDGTYGFLRSLPLDAKHVFFGKLMYGLTSTGLLALALLFPCLVARMLLISRGLSPDREELMPQGMDGLYAFLIVLIPVTLTVGVFWSLQFKRPIFSLIATACSLLTAPLVPIFCDMAHRKATGVLTTRITLAETVGICILLMLIAAFFYFVDRRLVHDWLPNRTLSDVNPFAGPTVSQLPAARRSSFARLLWLQAKSQWLLLVAAATICSGLVMLTIGRDWGHRSLTMQYLSPMPVNLLAGLIGVLVFREEQANGRFRFLAQLGVSPSSYWLSRILVPSFFAASVAFLAGYAMLLHGRASGLDALFATMSALSAFAIGLLASLASSSTIIAFAIAFGGILVCWTWIMACAVLGVPFWLCGLPCIVLPLLASYLRVPRWFQQTKSWKQWIVPLIPIAALILLVPAATGLYRIYEIPNVELPANSPHWTSP